MARQSGGSSCAGCVVLIVLVFVLAAVAGFAFNVGGSFFR